MKIAGCLIEMLFLNEESDIESRLMMSPQKKNKLVTSMNGTRYLFVWLIAVSLVNPLILRNSTSPKIYTRWFACMFHPVLKWCWGMKVHLGYPDNVEFPNKEPHAEYRSVHLLLPARLRLKNFPNKIECRVAL